MRGELIIPASLLIAFGLVLIRVIGIFIFIPMPVKDAGPGVARIVFAVATSIALFPCWPQIDAYGITFGTVLLWVASEAAMGLAIGLMVAFLAEAMTLGAQLLSQQAGYSYASIVDPVTQADSNVLPAAAQIMAGLLFFTTGLHRTLVGILAATITTYPPGSFSVSQDLTKTVVGLAANAFSFGLRLALPIMGLLLLTDLALALLGRLNSQLHLSMQAFPVKMMLNLLTLMTVFAAAPLLYQAYASDIVANLHRYFVR